MFSAACPRRQPLRSWSRYSCLLTALKAIGLMVVCSISILSRLPSLRNASKGRGRHPGRLDAFRAIVSDFRAVRRNTKHRWHCLAGCFYRSVGSPCRVLFSSSHNRLQTRNHLGLARSGDSLGVYLSSWNYLCVRVESL